jgi:hypothetical protein
MKNKNELFKGIEKSYKYAVVYTEEVIRGSYLDIYQRCGHNSIVWKHSNEKRYYINANFFKTLSESEKDTSILKSISNRKYINVHIVKR